MYNLVRTGDHVTCTTFRKVRGKVRTLSDAERRLSPGNALPARLAAADSQLAPAWRASEVST